MQISTNPKEDSEDTFLVLLAQTRDRAALEQLLRERHASLQRYTISLAGPDLADDVLQETTPPRWRRRYYLNSNQTSYILLLKVRKMFHVEHSQIGSMFHVEHFEKLDHIPAGGIFDDKIHRLLQRGPGTKNSRHPRRLQLRNILLRNRPTHHH